MLRKGHSLKSHPLYESTVVAVASRKAEGAVRWYADLLTGRRNARVFTVYQVETLDSSIDVVGNTESDSVTSVIRQFAKANRIGLIVSEWFPNPWKLQSLLILAHELRVTAVFIRQNNIASIGRVLVATTGGPNVLEQMWIANGIASAQGVSVELLHWRRDIADFGSLDPHANHAETVTIEQLSVRLLGMQAKFETYGGTNFAQCVVESLRKDDLLVMGTPNLLPGSLPDVVAKRVATPLILLSNPPNDRVSLRGLFWGGRLIQIDMRVRNKEEAIAALIKNLVLHNQLACSSKTDILDRALRREEIMSTATDCETAFPHVMLKRFIGVVASMGICPDGVAFDSDKGRTTKFLYLLITPDGLCDEYLATLAKIARRMINPEVREALLACETSAHAMDILEPRTQEAL